MPADPDTDIVVGASGRDAAAVVRLKPGRVVYSGHFLELTRSNGLGISGIKH
jgi:hypothetical protein